MHTTHTPEAAGEINPYACAPALKHSRALPRPLSVFLLQLLLGSIAALLIFGIVSTALLLLGFGHASVSWLTLLLFNVMRIMLLALMVGAIINLQAGGRWGRIVGMLPLGTACLVWGWAYTPLNVDVFIRAWPTLIGTGLLPVVVLVWWMWSLCFSRRARAWFRRSA